MRASSRRRSGPRRVLQRRSISPSRWSRSFRIQPYSPMPSTSATLTARTSAPSNASRPTGVGSASTMRPPWPSSCGTWAFRPGSPRASCQGLVTHRPARSGSSSTTPMPGWRSISRGSAGSPSIRPAATSPSWRRCLPDTRWRAAAHGRPRVRSRKARWPRGGSGTRARPDRSARPPVGPLAHWSSSGCSCC